jgi:hypothetical protein
MILYLFYSANFYDIKTDKKDGKLGYVDDKLIIAEGTTLEENVERIKDFMEREGGAFTWAKNHSSKFELKKLSLIHFHRCNKSQPNDPLPVLQLNLKTITPKSMMKYLGVILDKRLQWHQQCLEIIKVKLI